MNVQSIKITETRGIIQFGEAIIEGINVIFSFNPKNDKFTFIGYDEYKARNIFPQGVSNDVPQKYLVGRIISKALKNN